jgi:putative endonuclease
MFYVYAIKSTKNGRIYVGQTFDVLLRLEKHNQGSVKSTSTDRPWVLIKQESHSSREEARWHERQLKKSRGRRLRWLAGG